MKLEGNPISDYKLFALITGALVGLPMFVGALLIRFTCKAVGIAPTGAAPRVLVGFHQDFPVLMASNQFWEIYKSEEAGWVGNHSFLSYFPSLELMLAKVHAIRYDRRHPDVYGQVLKGMQAYGGDVAIRTDSGTPYNVVRKSAIRFAIDSGRGLVGFRQKSNRYFRIYGHYFPLPFSTITTTWTRFFSHTELKTQSIDYWRDELQREMEAI